MPLFYLCSILTSVLPPGGEGDDWPLDKSDWPVGLEPPSPRGRGRPKTKKVTAAPKALEKVLVFIERNGKSSLENGDKIFEGFPKMRKTTEFFLVQSFAL